MIQVNIHFRYPVLIVQLRQVRKNFTKRAAPRTLLRYSYEYRKLLL